MYKQQYQTLKYDIRNNLLPQLRSLSKNKIKSNLKSKSLKIIS